VTRLPLSSLHIRTLLFAILLTAGLTVPTHATAQTATGAIAGRIVDQQNAAIPGTRIQATNKETGFNRSDVSDATGNYHLGALPVGTYRVVSELSGFSPVEASVTVNIGNTVALDLTLAVARQTENVTISAAPPLISTRTSSVGDVVDLTRIESLPLNGRQFANLAATVPGVGLGFHSDTSKSAQYSPQISGGNGRNVNYVVDGGDNNDDTVGGLLQLYPLEAIQEFNVLTQRFDAEYGRSDGGVLNVVTKSGTNTMRGSWFTLVRDDAMNARTMTEQLKNLAKQPYERYQYGGSLGGPVVLNKVHYFAAYERTQQDTTQAVNTFGLFPAQEGVFNVPFRENLFTAKVTTTLSPAHYLSVRYSHDDNSQPSGAGPTTVHSAWSTSTNRFESVNVNHNWITGGAALNEAVFQYSRFRNDTPVTAQGPTLQFPNGVFAGGSPTAPQSTEQDKWQYRDDFSWMRSGFGLSHQFRTGVNWTHEPRLFAETAQFTSGYFLLRDNDINGPVRRVLKIGGNVSSNIPLDLYGLYGQDDWRVTDRLTFNLGLRWDYVDGMPIDQSQSANFRAMQAAGAAGRFAGTFLDDFGKTTRGDRNNLQPRLGAVYDLRGNGKDVIRGGWGIYTDFAYTASNALTASLDAAGGGGIVFAASTSTGIKKADGTFFHVTDPLSDIAFRNAVNPDAPTSGEVVSPVLQQPFTYQTNLGWSHELSRSTAVSLDYVKVQGRDLNMRIRPNTLVNGKLYIGDVGISPNDPTFVTAVSRGRSEYDALIASLRRRMSNRLDLSAAYTLANATSNVGSAYDEIERNLIQDITQPFSAVQDAPSARTDARHRVQISAVIEAPFDIRVAPIFFYRSPLPVHTLAGIDVNGDGQLNDKSAHAYSYTGFNQTTGVATYKDDGPCETVNCSRRAPFSQLNLRVSRSFRLMGTARIEAIAEVFNLFNATNPFIPLTTQQLTNATTQNPQFMQPTAFAGDVGQSEQRIGQVGFRLTF
jgi:hypothetical protein